MPTRPSVCSEPGCPNLTPCADHQRKPWAGRNGTTSRRDRGITGSGWNEQKRNRRTLREHHGICWWCGQPGADTVDHVTELADGGTDTPDNRKPIHANPCHTTKTTQARRTRGHSPPTHP